MLMHSLRFEALDENENVESPDWLEFSCGRISPKSLKTAIRLSIPEILQRDIILLFQAHRQSLAMSKRHAEDIESGGVSLKGGERPEKADEEDEVGEFEDEFEDEYESEDEILEAGVDGRPDAEREAEEKAGIVDQCATFLKCN
jgi:hypothetical protein